MKIEDTKQALRVLNRAGGCLRNCTCMECSYSCENALKEALEKRIPKEPKKLTYTALINNGWTWECPNCSLAVGENKNALDYTGQDKFCPSCGQALKW